MIAPTPVNAIWSVQCLNERAHDGPKNDSFPRTIQSETRRGLVWNSPGRRSYNRRQVNMVRIQRDRDLPLHYEASPLKAAVMVAGWMVGILATVAGMAGFVRAESTVAEAAAASLILIGGTLVVALIRCRGDGWRTEDRASAGAVSKNPADRMRGGSHAAPGDLVAPSLCPLGAGSHPGPRYSDCDRTHSRARRTPRRPCGARGE